MDFEPDVRWKEYMCPEPLLTWFSTWPATPDTEAQHFERWTVNRFFPKDVFCISFKKYNRFLYPLHSSSYLLKLISSIKSNNRGSIC